MGSIHDSRWLDFDRAMSKSIELENQHRQHDIYVNGGGTMSFEEFMTDGRYDPSDWGLVEEISKRNP